MLLVSRKRRRSKMERKEEEEKDIAHKKEVEEMTHTIFSLKQKIEDFQEIERENEENIKKLSKLYHSGIIDSNGDPAKQYSDDMH